MSKVVKKVWACVKKPLMYESQHEPLAYWQKWVVLINSPQKWLVRKIIQRREVTAPSIKTWLTQTSAHYVEIRPAGHSSRVLLLPSLVCSKLKRELKWKCFIIFANTNDDSFGKLLWLSATTDNEHILCYWVSTTSDQLLAKLLSSDKYFQMYWRQKCKAHVSYQSMQVHVHFSLPQCTVQMQSPTATLNTIKCSTAWIQNLISSPFITSRQPLSLPLERNKNPLSP